MTKVHIKNAIDHNLMYDIEQVTYSEELRAFWSRERFIARHVSLPAIGFWSGEKCIGGVYMENGFIHISVLPEYHGKWSVLYAHGLDWAMSHASPIYASIIEGNEKCVRFAVHSGWEKVGHFNGVVYYRSTKSLHDRLLKRRHRLVADRG